MNFYPFHIGDYAAHTRNLSLMEDLAYRRLLDAYYLAERPLSGTVADVARAVGMRDHLESVEYVLGQFFVATSDGWTNTRADDEIEKFRIKSEQASRAGRASAARRGSARSTPVENTATGVQLPITHEPLPITQEPITNKTDVAQSAPSAPPADVLLVFEFWKAAMKSPRSLLDDKRKGVIKRALKTGYTVDQLCSAISGCAKSEYHMGKNKDGQKYNGLDLILRDAEKIDKFIIIGQSPHIPRRSDGAQKLITDLSTMNYDRDPDDYTF